MICPDFKPYEKDVPNDCWMCLQWMYWSPTAYCILPEREVKRQRELASKHPHQQILFSEGFAPRGKKFLVKRVKT